MPNDAVLTMRGICKTFFGIKALNNVDFTLRKGEIHALMGENGAGKSRFYRLPKKLIAIRNPYSEERRKKQREQALLENYRERFTENNETSGREEVR